MRVVDGTRQSTPLPKHDILHFGNHKIVVLMHQTHNYFVPLALCVCFYTVFVYSVFLIHVLWLKCKFHYIPHIPKSFPFFVASNLFYFYFYFYSLVIPNNWNVYIFRRRVTFSVENFRSFCGTKRTMLYSIFTAFSKVESERESGSEKTYISHSSE